MTPTGIQASKEPAWGVGSILVHWELSVTCHASFCRAWNVFRGGAPPLVWGPPRIVSLFVNTFTFSLQTLFVYSFESCFSCSEVFGDWGLEVTSDVVSLGRLGRFSSPSSLQSLIEGVCALIFQSFLWTEAVEVSCSGLPVALPFASSTREKNDSHLCIYFCKYVCIQLCIDSFCTPWWRPECTQERHSERRREESAVSSSFKRGAQFLSFVQGAEKREPALPRGACATTS